MKLGVKSMMTDEEIPPADLRQAAEERGFDSLFAPDHSHIPVQRDTPYPTGGELPREYYRLLDPFAALTAAAAVTEHLLVGTGVVPCLPTRPDPDDPIQTTKASATLDVVSNGRPIFGFGPKIRGKIADE